MRGTNIDAPETGDPRPGRRSGRVATEGIGLIMLAVVVVGNLMRSRGRVYGSAWFLRVCEWVAPLGFVAVLAGWITTEVGSQPWTVYGLLRTADSVSPSLTGADVALSLAGYMIA